MNDDLNKQEVDAYLTVLLPSLLIPRFAVHLVVPDGYQMQIGYYPSSPQKMFEIYKLEKKPGEGISIHSSAADINLVYESSGQHFNEKRKNAFSMHFPLSSMKIDAAKTPHRTTLDQCGVYLIDTNKVEDSPKRVRKMAAFGDLEKCKPD